MQSTSAQLNQEPSHSCALHALNKKNGYLSRCAHAGGSHSAPPHVQLVGISIVKEIVQRRKNLSTLEEDHSLKPLILSSLEVSHSWGTLVIGFIQIDPAHEF